MDMIILLILSHTPLRSLSCLRITPHLKIFLGRSFFKKYS